MKRKLVSVLLCAAMVGATLAGATTVFAEEEAATEEAAAEETTDEAAAEEEAAEETTEEAAEEESTEAASEEAADAETTAFDGKLGVIVLEADHGWTAGVSYYAEQKCDEMGIDYQIYTSNNVNDQANQIEQAISDGCTAIILSPHSLGGKAHTSSSTKLILG